MNRTKGRAIDIVYDSSNFKTCYFDEYTGEILPLELVQAAMMEEINDFSEKTMWAAAEYSETKANTDATFVRMRWVLCNKGNEKESDVRARLVACEIAKDKQCQCDASTPPLESMKCLFSRYAHERSRAGEALQLSFVDVMKAYFNGTPMRDICMSPPRELGQPW